MEAIFSQAAEYNQQGRMYYGLDKFEEALGMYQKAEEADPSNIETYLNMAEVYIITKRLAEAKETLVKIFLVDKNNGEANFHLGNIAYMEGDLEEARSLYTKSLNFGYEQAVVMYHLGCVYLELGDLSNALFYFRKAIKADPYNSAARLRKIEILVAQEKFEEALRSADELIEARPDTFEGYHYKFITLLGLDRAEEGNQVLGTAMELFPDDIGFVYDRIKYYEHIEDYDAALKLIEERFTGDEPEWKGIRKEKAKILMAVQRLDEAKALFREIVDDEYDDEMCYCLMHLYIGYEEYENVLDCCAKIINAGNENEYYFSAVYYEAVCHKKMGNTDNAMVKFEEAQKLFRFACSKYPGNLILYLYRALCYRELKDFTKSFEMLEYIINVSDGQLAEAYYVRSLLYTDMHEDEKAKADMNKALGMRKQLRDILM